MQDAADHAPGNRARGEVVEREKSVLVAVWSANGGAGCSVVAAALGLAAPRPVRIADCDGAQPELLGLASDPEPGLDEWVALGPDAPVEALARMSVTITAGVELVPRGAPWALGRAAEVVVSIPAPGLLAHLTAEVRGRARAEVSLPAWAP